MPHTIHTLYLDRLKTTERCHTLYVERLNTTAQYHVPSRDCCLLVRKESCVRLLALIKVIKVSQPTWTDRATKNLTSETEGETILVGDWLMFLFLFLSRHSLWQSTHTHTHARTHVHRERERERGRGRERETDRQTDTHTHTHTHTHTCNREHMLCVTQRSTSC